MLAIAGWPLAEMLNGDFLRSAGQTNGRAPSLFNGHLFDHLPFLFVAFGGLAFLELQTKDTVKDGDYNFDPCAHPHASHPPIAPLGPPPITPRM